MTTFTVVTIFPRMFESPLGHSILRRAQEKNLISINLVDPRLYATDRHRMTDDYPYGGGQGMVMKVEPLVGAIEEIRNFLRQYPRYFAFASRTRLQPRNRGAPGP